MIIFDKKQRLYLNTIRGKDKNDIARPIEIVIIRALSSIGDSMVATYEKVREILDGVDTSFGALLVLTELQRLQTETFASESTQAFTVVDISEAALGPHAAIQITFECKQVGEVGVFIRSLNGGIRYIDYNERRIEQGENGRVSIKILKSVFYDGQQLYIQLGEDREAAVIDLDAKLIVPESGLTDEKGEIDLLKLERDHLVEKIERFVKKLVEVVNGMDLFDWKTPVSMQMEDSSVHDFTFQWFYDILCKDRNRLDAVNNRFLELGEARFIKGEPVLYADSLKSLVKSRSEKAEN